jgi:hypothetical protein
LDSTLIEYELKIQNTDSNIEVKLIVAPFLNNFEFYFGQHLSKMKIIKRQPSFRKHKKITPKHLFFSSSKVYFGQ